MCCYDVYDCDDDDYTRAAANTNPNIELGPHLDLPTPFSMHPDTFSPHPLSFYSILTTSTPSRQKDPPPQTSPTRPHPPRNPNISPYPQSTAFIAPHPQLPQPSSPDSIFFPPTHPLTYPESIRSHSHPIEPKYPYATLPCHIPKHPLRHNIPSTCLERRFGSGWGIRAVTAIPNNQELRFRREERIRMGEWWRGGWLLSMLLLLLLCYCLGDWEMWVGWEVVLC